MKFDAKKILLAGTAIVAVGAFSMAHAQAADLTTASSVTFASSGGKTSANVSNAVSGDNVAIITGAATLTIENNGVSTDSVADGFNTFHVGDITDTTGGVGTLIVKNGLNPSTAAAFPGNLTVTINSVNIDGNATISDRDVDDSNNATTFTAASSIGGALLVTNLETDAAKTVSLTTGSDLSVTGTTGVTGGGFAGSTSTLSIAGNAAFGGDVTLTDATGGAFLTFNGTTAQTVGGAGAIKGNAGNSGTVTIANSAGVTFNDVVGSTALKTILIDNGTSNSSATFTKTVNATSGIVVGSGAGTDTNTLTLDASGGSFTATGAITGGSAGETDNVVVAGGTGKVVTIASALGTGSSNIDSVTVTSGTTLTASSTLRTASLALQGTSILNAGGNVTAPITMGTGSTINTGNNNVVFDGDISGHGTLAVAHTGVAVNGSLGNGNQLTAITVANGDDLTVTTAAGTVNAAGSRTIDAASIVLTGSGALNLTATGSNTITVADVIAAAATGNGTVGVNDATGTVVFATNVGVSGTPVGALTVANGAGVNTINANGSLFVNTITLNTSDTLNLLGASGTVSGAITSGGAGRGAVVVGDGVHGSNYTFGGAIGGTTVGGFQVTTASTANISQNVATTSSGAGVAGVNIDGTLNIDSTNNTVAVSTATGTTDIDGTVAVTGANNVTISGAAGTLIDGALSTNLSGTAKTLTLASTGNVMTIGATSDTTITALNQIVDTSTATTIGATGRTTTLLFGATPDFNPDTIAGGHGVVNASATTLTLPAGSVLKVGAIGSNSLVDGSTVTVMDTGAGTSFVTALGDGRVVLQNTGLVHLTDNTSTATALNVLVTFQDPTSTFGDKVGANAADTLMDLTTATGTLQQARNNLLNAPTAAAAQEVAESISPTVDGGNVIGAMDASSQVLGVVQTRLASLEGRSTETSMAAGNLPSGTHVWGQAFGQVANQDNRGGVDGYDAHTYGGAVGADGEAMNGKGHLGVGVSYARTNVDSDNSNNTKTDIDSYQLTVYGDMDVQNDMYLSGMAAYAFDDNTSTRHNVGGVAGLNANGDFNANQFAANLELGRPYAMQGGLVLTPSVLADYMYYNADSYTETGAGTANLNVDQDSVNKLDLGVGINAGWTFQNADGSFLKPGLNASYRYDVIGDNIQSTSSFTGGGAAFNTDGLDPARSQFDVGASVKYMTVNNWDFSAQYDYTFKSDYDAHSGILRAGYKF